MPWYIIKVVTDTDSEMYMLVAQPGQLVDVDTTEWKFNQSAMLGSALCCDSVFNSS